MILERDERTLLRTHRVAPLLGGVACLVLSGGLAWLGGSPMLAAGLLALLLPLLLLAAAHRRFLLTDRSLVSYYPWLAWLARRLPRLARFEARTRRGVRLGDVLRVRRLDTRLELLARTGQVWTFNCQGEETAASLLRGVEELVRARGPQYRPGSTGRLALQDQIQVQQVAAGEPAEAGTRCPYCHAEVAREEAAACPRCEAVHHDECLDVHGGCASFACQGRARDPLRTR